MICMTIDMGAIGNVALHAAMRFACAHGVHTRFNRRMWTAHLHGEARALARSHGRLGGGGCKAVGNRGRGGGGGARAAMAALSRRGP